MELIYSKHSLYKVILRMVHTRGLFKQYLSNTAQLSSG